MSLVAIPTEKNRHLAVKVKRPGERRSMSRSATRALDVLEAFGAARRPLRAVEIARMLDLTPSTANQLLKTMADSAHLLFDARSKTYQPSPRLVPAASWIADTYGLDSRIHDLVAEVRDRSGFVATVTTHSDLFMQVIDLAGPKDAGGERGLRISLFGSAIGSAFLSSLCDDEVRRLAERARVPAGEMPLVLDTLATIRRCGYADGPAADQHIWSIGMPLPAGVLHGRGVLGLAGPASIIRERTADYAGIMRDAVDRWMAGEEARP